MTVSLLVLLLCPVPLPPTQPASGYTVPDGFTVQRAADVADSFIAMGFDPAGRALLSVESGGLLWLEDADGDGFFEASGSYTEAISACQGLCWKDGVLFAVGSVDGQLGVHRMTPAADGRSLERIELLAPVAGDPGEHGPHAIVPGPDGALYLMLGDHVRMGTEPEPGSILVEGYEGSPLPILLDPRGHGHGVVYPAGHVVRLDPRSGAWRYHSVGYRNAYDIAFDRSGELFTFDSDMEWGVGLPWYRPVRFLHCVPGGEYGWRKASGAWPEYYADSLPGLVDVGRGSPTGVAFCWSERFPARYRGALLAGDWSEGRVLALHLRERGATYAGEVETLISSDEGFPVTDLAFGPDGALYFTTGGRGTIGRFEKLVFTGELEAAGPNAVQRPSVWLDDPDVARLTDPDPFVVRRALEALLAAGGAPPEAAGPLWSLLGHEDRWLRYAAMRVQRRHRVCGDPRRAPNPRASIAYYLALQPGGEHDPAAWSELASDPELALDSLRVEQLAHSPGSVELAPQLCELFPHNDPRVSRELAVVLAVGHPEHALGRLILGMESDPDRAQQIHYAYCLSAIEGGWTLEDARRAFRWFDLAETWTGGLSFPGYLAAMRGRIASRFTTAEKLELALKAPPRERLGLRTVVDFMGDVDDEALDRLVPAMQYAWGQATDFDRAAALRAVPGVSSPRLAAFLRRQVENPDAPRDEALTALARIGAAEDYPLLLNGLGTTSLDVAEACARALALIDRRPERPEPYRTVLDLARRHGSQRGFAFVRLLEHWAEDEPPAASEDWEVELARWERWGVSRFREFRAPDDSDVRRPRWSFEATLAFLESSADRPGNAALGAAAFERGSCMTCHVIGTRRSSLTGFGPDLTGATRRFNRRELLESIWFPSESIPDPYRTIVVELANGSRREGREVARDDRVLRLLLSDGTELELDRAEVVQMTTSLLSYMPEGLPTLLTLEDLKDLLAYLDVDGEVELARTEWTPLFDEVGRRLWAGDEALWKIRGGVLIGRSRGLERNEYIVSKVEWGDFELELDVKLTDGEGNSGIQYRSTEDPGAADPIGYQADVAEAGWGSLYATDGRGVLAAPEVALRREIVDRHGWNHVHLRVQGDRHRIEVNGRVTADVRDAEHDRGVLAFQLHQGGAMEVRFANARIRALAE